MRRVLLIVGLALLVVGGLLLNWHRERTALGEALVADVAALKTRPVERAGTGERPTHEDAFRCFAGMLDVTAGRLPPRPPGADAVRSGAAPVDDTVRSWLQSHSAWVAGLRACSDAKKLTYVEGLTPWAAGTSLRRQRLEPVLADLLDFTALELPVLLADGQVDLALERCAQTVSLFVDQSHLGLAGAERTRAAVWRMAPACTAALGKAAGPSRTAIAKEWSDQQARLPTPSKLVGLERVSLGFRLFSAAAGDAHHAALGEGAAAPASSMQRRVQLGRTWASWDAAMKQLESVADAPGPAREAAISAVDASLPSSMAAASNYGAAFTRLADTKAVLGLMAALALGTDALPPGATSNEAGVTYVDGEGVKLVLVRPPPLPAEKAVEPAPTP